MFCIQDRRSVAHDGKFQGIDFTMKIKNFGPISNGKISLKPLTIFVGPNNSGKSYAAMLIHSIVSSYNLPPHEVPSYHRHSSDTFDDDFKKILKWTKNLKLKELTNIPVPDSITNDIIETCFKIIFNDALPDQLKQNFTSQLNDLVRIGESSFNIDLDGTSKINVYCKDDNLLVTNVPKIEIKINIKKDKTAKPMSTNIDNKGNMVFNIWSEIDHEDIAHELLLELTRVVASKICMNIPSQSHYLPATRSGILQGHRAISAGIIEHAPYAMIDGTQIPPLTGIVSKFMSSLILPLNQKGPYFQLTEQMEEEMLGGHININSAKNRLPEIKYEFLDHEIPLHRTSSIVSELAPLTLYLKFRINKNDILIIEEPEAHLHPSNLLILARYVAKLIRKGLTILITTHSVFLLEQLSLLLQASTVDTKTKKNMGFNIDEFLSDNEVAPYAFVKNSTGNHNVESISCSSQDGISQEEFVKIQEILYHQNMRIEQNTVDFQV